jgi:acetyltransferase-like isoleucine patch superfamily enzyme
MEADRACGDTAGNAVNMKNYARNAAAGLIAKWRGWAKRRQWRRDNVVIAPGSYVHPSTTIGKCTRINAISHLGQCAIGAYCAIGGRLVVRSTNHRTNYLNMQDWAQKRVVRSDVMVAGEIEREVVIGNAVWIGDSVIVLPGVTIGDGAVVGAGSVVTRSIPAFSIAVGNPARVLRNRFSEKITKLLRTIRWWEWSEKKIRANRVLFETDLSNVSSSELQELIGQIRELGDD